MITVKLDSIRKNRNAQEWRMIPRARIGDSIEVVSDGNVIQQACKKAVLAGFDPSGLVRVIRNTGTVCFREKSLAEWADHGAITPQQQPDALKKHREAQQ